MLLNVSHIYKSFGEESIIKDATFTVDEGSKVAIVGNNGTGKSTLLKTLVGKIPAVNGYSWFFEDIKVGYFEQDLNWEYGEDTRSLPHSLLR